MTLAYHIRKWWDVANDRRQRLIVKKWQGGGITKAQEGELAMLQEVAGAIMNYSGPLRRLPEICAALMSHDSQER